MAQPLSEADIIFPHLSNTPNFSSTLSSLKRSALSITNRLNSISKDSEFVTNVAAAYDLPLIANERCGSWYIPPELKAASVYFKSTDGHMGEWAFSLRRLNLQLLDVVKQHGGCVIVDSTRRGKSMPDALSKTVPFWCCVMNRAVFGNENNGDEALKLFTPPAAVSESENVQMERRINGFVQQFLDICKPDIPSLRSKLQKPLRPLWVTQTSTLPPTIPEFPDFHPIILCTASHRVRGAEASEGGYIQGAADDHEAWSHGLTPSLFWNNKASLLHTNEEDLPSTIEQLVSQDSSTDAIATLIKPTTNLYVSSSQNIDLTSFDTIISCTPSPLPHASLKQASVKEYLHLPCQINKLGSRDLRAQLPALHQLVQSPTQNSPRPKTLICCPTGKDLAVGTALAYLVLFTNDSGIVDLTHAREAREIDKTLIKQRLSWVTTSNSALNPSRATLQSVNSVLMSSQEVGGKEKGGLAEVKDPALYDENWTLLSANLAAVTLDPTSTTSELGASDPMAENPPDPPSWPKTIFSRLPTTWTFTRTLTSALPTHPSGTVVGTASFSPTPLANTLLYAEEGTFTTTGGLVFTARRKYVYQLQSSSSSASDESSNESVSESESKRGKGEGEGEVETENKEGKDQHIIVRFFDDSTRRDDIGVSGEGVGGLFVEMGSLSLTSTQSSQSTSSAPTVFEARNIETHLCGSDLYSASWKFSGGMVLGEGEGENEGDWWEVRYDVQGPRKGYVSSTRYERVDWCRGDGGYVVMYSVHDAH